MNGVKSNRKFLPNPVLALFVILLLGVSSLFAQVVSYDWPTEVGEAVASDRYRVWVRLGTDAEQELEVLKSDAIYEGGEYVDGEAADLKGRTFSFASVSYAPTGGKALTFRVEKLFGQGSSKVVLAPRSYHISPEIKNEGKEVSFHVDKANRYISIDYAVADNRTLSHSWIKHMLCIFVDPMETDVPKKDDPGVVVYGPQVSADQLKNARVLYFARGHHNLKGVIKPGIIEDEGKLIVQDGQSVYLEGGAFVEAHVHYTGNGQKLYGRGILSGRQYVWHKRIKDRRSIISLGNNAVLTGIMIMESPLHGAVSGQDSLYENLKFLGWHWNNDGFRPNKRTTIRNSFMRCADDFFYNYELHVHNMVLWPGHNGAVLTFGWGSYKLGGSLLEDIDIINPEWVHLQNNNGLVMGQNQFDFYPTGPTTVLRNIRVEGSIPGVFNLHPRSERGEILATKLQDASKLGYNGNILLENITIDGQFSKGRISGAKDPLVKGKGTWYIKNIKVKDLTIGGVRVTNENKREFNTIDDETTLNINFESNVD